VSTLIHRFKTILLRIKNTVFPNFSFTWKIHLMKDFLGTKVWTKTSEVVTPLGFKLTSGYHPAYHLMRIGQFEVEETDVISRVLKQIDIFVDIGANLGYYTCLALQNKKHVIAFEPQQQNLDCLYKNLTINHWQSNAEIFPIALSDTPGLLTLYGASGPSASLIKNWAGYSSSFSKTVSINTLDNILLSRFLDKKLFIKIDVEGAEYSVLKGAINTISRLNKPIWLIEVCLDEFHPQGKNPDYLDIFNLFWANGYQAFTASKNIQLVNDHEIKGWFDAGKSQSGTFNYLFAESSELLNFN
jgi:FkbM family methyltransferase